MHVFVCRCRSDWMDWIRWWTVRLTVWLYQVYGIIFSIVVADVVANDELPLLQKFVHTTFKIDKYPWRRQTVWRTWMSACNTHKNSFVAEKQQKHSIKSIFSSGNEATQCFVWRDSGWKKNTYIWDNWIVELMVLAGWLTGWRCCSVIRTYSLLQQFAVDTAAVWAYCPITTRTHSPISSVGRTTHLSHFSFYLFFDFPPSRPIFKWSPCHRRTKCEFFVQKFLRIKFWK